MASRTGDWHEELKTAAARRAAEKVDDALAAVQAATTEARSTASGASRTERADREADARTLALHLPAPLIGMAAGLLIDADESDQRDRVRNWLDEAMAKTGEERLVEVAAVLREMTVGTERKLAECEDLDEEGGPGGTREGV